MTLPNLALLSPSPSSSLLLTFLHLEITDQALLCALVASSLAVTMETLTSCKTASLSELVPKRYLTQIFQSCPEVEGLAGMVELEDSEQYDLSSRDESGKNKKKNKINKIWNFVSRRKGPSYQGKRPQSMILLGENSKSSELKHKVTLMDRMKSFKRLKPSVGASKNTVPRSSKPQEPQEFSSSYHMRKAEQTPKPFRHSYAGHIEVPEPFLPEAQRFVHTPNRENQKVWTFKDSGIQVEEDSCEKEALGQPGSRGSRWARSYLKNMFPGDHEALQISARNSRIQELKVIIEGSNLEGNVEGGYEESPGHLRRDKAASFGGVVKFFSNMAEVARKWRAFSREEPQMGCQSHCHPRREAYLVHDTHSFILKGAASQDYSQVNLPFRPPEAALCGRAIGRHQHCHLNASQASCTFQMSIEDKKISGQALEDPCSTAALTWMSTSTAFEFQNDPMPQKGYSCHYSGAFTREHCSSGELEEDTKTVVSFLKQVDSDGESPELSTCSRRAATQAVIEKLEENLSKMEEQEASRGPTGSSQAGQPYKSDLGMDAADTEIEASKACTEVSNTQVRGELSFQITI